jgi:spore coat protein U-like protein
LINYLLAAFSETIRRSASETGSAAAAPSGCRGGCSIIIQPFQQPIHLRKNDMKKLAIIGAVLTALPGLVSATQPAFAAGTATSTFRVTLTITSGCAVSTPADINLGTGLTAAGLNSAGAAQTTTFTVTCSTGTGYTIGFAGINDTTTTHNMKGTGLGLLIPYQLTDVTTGAKNSSPLSAASAATPSLISDTGTGSAQSKTIQAAVLAKSIPGGAAPDAYYDTVTLTLSY